MKPKKPVKNKSEVSFNTLFLLIIFCCLSFVVIVMVSCLLGRLIVYIKTGALIFNWERDVFYSLRTGFSAGSATGFGIWIKAKLQERRDKK